MWILKLVASLSGFFAWLKVFSAKREGRTEAQNETLKSNVEELKRRDEAVNDEPKTSYDGDPGRIRDWLRAHRSEPKD